jgi:hypothetical protein
MNRTFQEIRAYCLRAGWADLSDTGQSLLTVRINSTLQHLVGMRPWPDYEAQGSMQLTAPYSTGTVTLTLDSAAVTGDSTVWTAAMVGQEFVGPDGRPYTIAAVTNNTALTLAENYLGASVASGGAYSIRYIRYAMPTGCLRVGRMKHRLCGWLTDERDISDFQARRLELHAESQAPTCVWKRRPYFYFDPSPSAADQIRFPYWTAPERITTDSDVTDWPEALDWLLWAALGLTVREKSEQDAAAVLYQPAFQEYVNTAFRQADASAEPIRLNVGRSPVGPGWQDFQALFTIAPDV